MDRSQETYEGLGAEFLIPQYSIAEKAQTIKAFLFDWDGVFNTGTKEVGGSSSFNEIDSMGTNLLRFSYYYKNRQLPPTAIISGEKNESAFFFSKREHFNASYSKFPDKRIALQHFCETNKIKPSEICFFFDDVLDLAVASVVGLRIFVPHKFTPEFTRYVKQNELADYITGSVSGGYAVREACEMLMTANGLYNEVITLRMNFADLYKQYIALRNDTPTQFFTSSNGSVIPAE